MLGEFERMKLSASANTGDSWGQLRYVVRCFLLLASELRTVPFPFPISPLQHLSIQLDGLWTLRFLQQQMTAIFETTSYYHCCVFFTSFHVVLVAPPVVNRTLFFQHMYGASSSFINFDAMVLTPLSL